MTSGGWKLETKYKNLVSICKEVLECYFDGDDGEKLIIDGQLDDHHFETMRKLGDALAGEYKLEKRVS